MSDSGPTNMPLPQEQPEIFRVLYPIFKDEVFRRREHMIRLSAFHSAVLVLVMVMMMTRSPEQTSHSAIPWLAMSGIALFSGFFAFLILQQADRHRMAKQQLIALEKRMGLYKKDGNGPGKATYPKNWQTDWLADRSVTIYLAVLTAFTVLVICVMLLHD